MLYFILFSYWSYVYKSNCILCRLRFWELHISKSNDREKDISYDKNRWRFLPILLKMMFVYYCFFFFNSSFRNVLWWHCFNNVQEENNAQSGVRVRVRVFSSPSPSPLIARKVSSIFNYGTFLSNSKALISLAILNKIIIG